MSKARISSHTTADAAREAAKAAAFDGAVRFIPADGKHPERWEAYGAHRREVKFTAQTVLTAVDPVRRILNERGEAFGIAVYGGRFVRAVRSVREHRHGTADSTGTQPPVETVEFVPFSALALAEALQPINFVRSTKRRNGPQDELIDCPAVIANTLLDTADRCPALAIDGIAMTPVLRGTILHSGTGHKRALGKWLQAPEIILPDRISQADAAAALVRVRAWLSEFCFSSPPDESAAVALFLTAAMRASLRHAPGTLISKPDYGAGASTLTNATHIILSGTRAAVLECSRGGDELTKAIDAAMRDGLPAIVLDNIPRGLQLNNTALAQLLTETTRSARILGKSENMRLPCTQLVIANGNNAGVAADLVRRFVKIELASRGQNSAGHAFKRPALLDDMQRARDSILRDLYTIVIAYRQSGATVETLRIGFDDWSQAIAAPLVWLGLPDPTLTQRAITDDDPERADADALLRCWFGLVGNKPTTVAHVLAYPTADTATANVHALQAELKELVASVGTFKASDAQRLGIMAHKFQGMTVNGMTLHKCGGKPTRWRLDGAPGDLDWLST